MSEDFYEVETGIWASYNAPYASLVEKDYTATTLGAYAQYAGPSFATAGFAKLVGYAIADQNGRLEIQQGRNDFTDDVISEYDLEIVDVSVDRAFSYNGNTAAYTDETTDINNATADDVVLPPIQTTSPGDAIYFGSYVRFNWIKVNTSTAGIYSDITLAWEYYNGSTWVAVPNLTDDTVGFTATGIKSVTFDMPTDMAETTVKGTTMYWVRCVATLGASPSITTAPLGAQAWNRPMVEIPYVIDVVAPYARMCYYNKATKQSYFRAVCNLRRF